MQQHNDFRVAILIPSSSGGGAEFVAMQWATYLSGRGYTVQMLLTHPRRGEIEQRVPERILISRVKGRTAVAKTLALRHYMIAERPDVVLSLMPYWNLMAIIASQLLPNKPRIYISGRNIETALREVQNLKYRIEVQLAKILYRRADAYIAISHPTAAEAITAYGVARDNVWVVPNPATGKTGSNPRELRKLPTVASGVHLTLSVPARLVEQKRPLLAIRVAALLTAEFGVPTTVEFFGSGPVQIQIQQLAQQLDVPVKFHGWVERWYEECADNSVVLLPSLVEGFGNVLLEAAAVGIPCVVSSRALGVADAIVPGITGVLSMDDSAAAFAEAVMETRSIVRVDYTRWLARFSPESSGQRLEAAIRGHRE
jgi:glycosyltransferase involved in cell wall biosynthesis